MDSDSAFPHDTDTTSEPNGFSIITPSVSTADDDASLGGEISSTGNTSRVENTHDSDAASNSDFIGHSECPGAIPQVVQQQTGFTKEAQDAETKSNSDKGATHYETIERQEDRTQEGLIGIALTFERELDASTADELIRIAKEITQNEVCHYAKFRFGEVSTTPLRSSWKTENESQKKDPDSPHVSEDAQSDVYTKYLIMKTQQQDFETTVGDDAAPSVEPKKTKPAASLQSELTRARILNNLGQCKKNMTPCFCTKETYLKHKASVEASPTIDEDILPISDVVDKAQARIQHMLDGCKRAPFPEEMEMGPVSFTHRTGKRASNLLMGVSVFILCIVGLFSLYQEKEGKWEQKTESRQCLGIWVG